MSDQMKKKAIDFLADNYGKVDPKTGRHPVSIEITAAMAEFAISVNVELLDACEGAKRLILQEATDKALELLDQAIAKARGDV